MRDRGFVHPLPTYKKSNPKLLIYTDILLDVKNMKVMRFTKINWYNDNLDDEIIEITPNY